MAQQPRQLSPDEERKVELFLANNNVLEDWKNIIRAKSELNNNVLEFLNKNKFDLRHGNHDILQDNNILRAFSICTPINIKVVIVGHDLIWESDLASGLSFSFPERKKFDINVGNDRPMLYEEGCSIEVLHDVLVDAGFLERGGTYDYCHEIWAKKGVLLLNTFITYGNGFDFWEEFIKQILFQVAKKIEHEPLFFLFWGSGAKTVGKWLSSELKRRKYWLQTIRDEDHRERIDERAPLVLFIGDHPIWLLDKNKPVYIKQAVNQFLAIRMRYPDLFTLPKLA